MEKRRGIAAQFILAGLLLITCFSGCATSTFGEWLS
jgi:hypothetical protein